MNSACMNGIKAAAAMALVMTSAPALAQKPAGVPEGWPAKPVRVLIGLAPGGGVDVITRAKPGARAKPGELNYGTAGPGSSGHLGHELFNSMAGVKMTHIPYKGSGAVLPDLIAGRVQLGFLSTLGAVSQVKNGTLRALGVTSRQRVAGFADVPTIAESGIAGFENFEWGNNYGLFIPIRTPAAIVNAINRDVTQALHQPDMKTRLAADGAEAPGPHLPAQYRARVEENIARWTAVVKASGLMPDS